MATLRLMKSVGFFSLLLLTLFSAGCMGPISCAPSQLSSFYARAENIRLEFETKKGRQVAFYIPSLNSPENPPTQINILYPGIASVALGWQRFIPLEEYPDAAYLLIDYPGRGLSEGMMHPEKLYRNTAGALKALSEKFGTTEFDAELNVMGHSFGAGAALQFAARAKVERIVLIAPFNSLRKAVALQSYILSILIPFQIDNRKFIRKILRADKPPQIAILHGSMDDTLPVTMGRELAAISPDQIDYYEFAEDGHVSILEAHRDMLFGLLNGRNNRFMTSGREWTLPGGP